MLGVMICKRQKEQEQKHAYEKRVVCMSLWRSTEQF